MYMCEYVVIPFQFTQNSVAVSVNQKKKQNIAR